MAFDYTQLDLIAHANGHAVYRYTEDDDDREDVCAVGYFNNTDDKLALRVDDIIQVCGDEGFYRIRVVSINSSTGAITSDMIDNFFVGPARITSVAGTTSAWLIAPFAGLIRRVRTVALGAVSDDTTIGLELAGTNVTDGASADIVTIATGGAAGDVDSGEADAANAVTDGQAIEVTCGGEGSTATAADVYVEVLPAS